LPAWLLTRLFLAVGGSLCTKTHMQLSHFTEQQNTNRTENHSLGFA